MLLSSSGAIYIATYIEWNLVYELFSLVIILFAITILLLVKEKNLINITSLKTNILGDEFHGNLMLQIKYLIAKILNPLGGKSYILMILLFLILYRLPDNFINMMINPFLLHIGYNDFEIATAGKFFGITSAIIGGLISSTLLTLVVVPAVFSYIDRFRIWIKAKLWKMVE
jgi:PAT family beta-lactamase induction signal transducer AmpG